MTERVATFEAPHDLSATARDEWAALAEHCADAGPLLDPVWMTSWCEAFTPIEPLVLSVRRGTSLLGLATLQRMRERWAGVRVEVLQSLTNVESFRYAFLSAPEPSSEEGQHLMWSTLLDASGADVIRLDHVPEQSATVAAALTEARARGWRVHIHPTFDSPFRRLPVPPTRWDDGLKRKFKSNLRNREKRLRKLGEIDFEVANGERRHRALDAFYQLEASGWKGDEGTAIINRDDAKQFYDRLVAQAADVWIPLLSVDGRPIAAQVIRVQGGTMFLLKTAYDPEYRIYSPGQLITSRVVQYGMASGLRVLDFLAAEMTWKEDWAPEHRRHGVLLVFAPNARGRYAYWTSVAVRESAKRIPGLRRIVRRLKRRRG